MDKNIQTHDGILLSHKKNEILAFTVTWLDLKIIRLSGVSQTKTAPCETTYVRNLSRDTNERLHETEVDTQA